MLMPGRNYNSTEYRFGYQGSEKDDEISGTTGAHYTTFFRELDARIGRWWSVDPKSNLTPWESPYVSMGNNPIWHNDVMGDSVRLTKAFQSSKEWMSSYNLWSQSKTGKKFLKDYGEGGKFEAVSVVFGLKEEVLGASGTSSSYFVDKETGEEHGLASSTIYKNAPSIVSGNDSKQFYRVKMNFFPGGTPSTAEGFETIIHESQHLRMDRQTLITNKMTAPTYTQHDWMRKGGWYQERFDNFKNNKSYWYQDYLKEKETGKTKSEDEYIDKKVNGYQR